MGFTIHRVVEKRFAIDGGLLKQKMGVHLTMRARCGTFFFSFLFVCVCVCFPRDFMRMPL